MNDLKRAIHSSRFDRPFIVIDIENQTFFDFNTASVYFSDTSKLGISQVARLKVTKDNQGIIYFKRNFSTLLLFQTC